MKLASLTYKTISWSKKVNGLNTLGKYYHLNKDVTANNLVPKED